MRWIGDAVLHHPLDVENRGAIDRHNQLPCWD